MITASALVMQSTPSGGNDYKDSGVRTRDARMEMNFALYKEVSLSLLKTENLGLSRANVILEAMKGNESRSGARKLIGQIIA